MVDYTIVELQLDFFNQYTAELHDMAKKLQNAEREHISEEIAILAAYCVKNMRIISEYDVVLCLAAFNVCNTYVKQHDRNPLFSYRFKRRIGALIDAVICNMIHSIKFDFQTDNEMHVTLIQVGNIQFSFHMVPISRADVDLVTKCGFTLELSWDQIYKQNCARSLFLASLACHYNTKVLTENEKVVLEHQIPLYEDYVAEVGKNLTWFGRLSRQKTLLPTISPDIFFHAPLSVGFGQIWKAAGFDWGGMT